jgi:hypothetical protein
LPRARFGASRPFCRLCRLTHHRYIVADRHALGIIADDVVALYSKPQTGNDQMHPPIDVHRMRYIVSIRQPIVEQA